MKVEKTGNLCEISSHTQVVFFLFVPKMSILMLEHKYEHQLFVEKRKRAHISLVEEHSLLLFKFFHVCNFCFYF